MKEDVSVGNEVGHPMLKKMSCRSQVSAESSHTCPGERVPKPTPGGPNTPFSGCGSIGLFQPDAFGYSSYS